MKRLSFIFLLSFLFFAANAQKYITKNGKYDVTVEGDLNIHNVTNKVTEKGTIEVVSGGINASSSFNIVPEYYKINIPGVVRDNIAKNLELTVTMKYAPGENK